jgi:predicted SprT family Zn-dependent metalloprotease
MNSDIYNTYTRQNLIFTNLYEICNYILWLNIKSLTDNNKQFKIALQIIYLPTPSTMYINSLM